MDSHDMLWWFCFLLVVVLDIVAWIGCFSQTADPDRRFRLFAAAGLLLFIGLGLLVGFGWSAGICAITLWVCGILSKPPVEEAPPVHSGGHH